MGLQLLVLIAAALYARSQVSEARKLREQQNRPFVSIDFEMEGNSLVFLEVSNLGTSLARDVKFEINPPLQSAIDLPFEKMKMLNEGISTLAPGKRIRTFFDSGFQRYESDLPNFYEVKVSYRDEDRRRTFDESLDLDLEIFLHLSTVTRHGVHDINARLKEIRDLMKKWSGSGNRGLLAMSPEEARSESERSMRLMESRRREEMDDGPSTP